MRNRLKFMVAQRMELGRIGFTRNVFDIWSRDEVAVVYVLDDTG